MGYFDELKKQLDPNREDPVPYDDNSGTATNIGRFMLNNVAKDPGYAGMFGAGLKAAPLVAPEVAEALKALEQNRSKYFASAVPALAGASPSEVSPMMKQAAPILNKADAVRAGTSAGLGSALFSRLKPLEQAGPPEQDGPPEAAGPQEDQSSDVSFAQNSAQNIADKGVLGQFLNKIGQNESSGGLNTNHQPVTSGPMKGQTALGTYGLLPTTIDGIMQKSGINDYDSNDPQVQQYAATQLAKQLYDKTGGDQNKMAYMWNHGTNLDPNNISDDKLDNDDYVQKFQGLKNQLASSE